MDLEMFKFMYNFYNENKVIVLTSIVSAIIRTGLDNIIIPRNLAAVFNSLTDADSKHGHIEFKNSLIMLVVLWIIMKIVFVLSTYCRKMIEPKITEYIVNKLVTAVFQKYEVVNELSDVSLLINKIHLIKKNLQELFYLMFTVFIPKMIVLVLSLVNITLVNKKIGAFISTCILLQGILIYNNYSNCLQTSFEEIEYQDKMYEYIQDVFHNINIVQSTFKGYELELTEISKLSDDVSIKEAITITCVNRQQNQSFFMNLGIFVIILVIVYNFYTTKQITNKEVVTMILSVNGMFDNIYDFAIYVPEIFSRIGVLNSNEEFLKELLRYAGTEQVVEELKQNFIIFNNVSFSFKDHNVLDNYSVAIPANKIVGLSGASGSGKSTFIKLIFGIEEPSKGEIFIGNVLITKNNCKSVRRYISYMNQNSSSLFDKSILDNILYGYGSSVDRNKIIELFEKFKLYDIFKNLDTDGVKYSFLDRPAGKLGSNLSGGQKALIHLLRLDFNPFSKIIILDEVTASLDNTSRDSIINYIKYLNQKKITVIIISHDTFMDSIYDIHLKFSHDRNPVIA